MDIITEGFRQIPAFVTELLSGPYLLPAVIVLFVYLTALFFNRKWAHTLRFALIIVLIAATVTAYVLKELPLACLLASALAVLIVYRLLVLLVVQSVRTYRNRAIEKQALKGVELRRGNRAMRSSAPGMAAAPQGDSASLPHTDEYTSGGSDVPAPEEDAPLTRARLTELTHMLRTLREYDLLTEEEFKEKTSQLYERMG